MGTYTFNINILYENGFQVTLDDYDYVYRDFVTYQGSQEETLKVWREGFEPGPLSQKLKYELDDYYMGRFVTWSGTYPDVRGPGGGGFSGKEYKGSWNQFFYDPRGGITCEMLFEKDLLLADNSKGLKNVESQLVYIIESALLNSIANRKEIYLDPIFTRDNRKRASNSLENSDGSQNPRYTPNGKTYSFPQSVEFELNKSFASEKTDYYYLSWIVKEIIPTPKKEPAPTQSGSQSSIPDSGTVSSDNLIRGNYIFNVEKPKVFKNSQLGELTIVEKVGSDGLPGETQPTEEEPTFIFDDTSEQQLDPEYMEGEFVGSEESYEGIVGEDLNSFNSINIDQTEGEKKEDYTTTTSTGSGETSNLKPSKKGYLMGTAFQKTEQYKQSWDTTVDTTYRLTGFKFGKPIITEDSFIQRVKKSEGGIANGTSDSAYREYGEKTVVPISTGAAGPDGKIYTNLMKSAGIKDAADSKRYDKICTNSSGKRLYNIHTSKGILWTVFKAQFGESLAVQERYLKMSDEDWWTIMYKRFVVANKGDKIKSKIASYFYVYWCWGSGAGNAVPLLNTTLNLLSGEKKFTTNQITNAQINFMNELYDSGKEDQLISAMYDVRIQNLLNISQPGNKNAVYRNGWINGINKWIKDFHES